MKKSVFFKSLLLGTALSACAAAVQAGETLDKLRQTGTVVLGVRESSIPFSYNDAQQNTVGYAQTLAEQVVARLRTELALPNLKVKLIPITSQNRIPLLLNGTIDLDCGSTSHTFARESQVAFSDSFFVYGVKMLVKRDSGIKDFGDLTHKVVASTAGTSAEREIRKLNESKKMDLQVISTKDHSEAFLDLETGRAAAFVMDEPLLFGERAKAHNPDDYVVVGTPLFKENYACMFRRDNADFKALIDSVIAHGQTDGTAAKLYEQWFTQPIPPKGMNLRYPMSDEMRELLRHPSDQALD
jgi:glutamate/aspartate transport system substrate-binding protein